MVKKLSPKQKKLASMASPRNKITGADFKKLAKKKKVLKLSGGGSANSTKGTSSSAMARKLKEVEEGRLSVKDALLYFTGKAIKKD